MASATARVLAARTGSAGIRRGGARVAPARKEGACVSRVCVVGSVSRTDGERVKGHVANDRPPVESEAAGHHSPRQCHDDEYVEHCRAHDRADPDAAWEEERKRG